MKTHYIQRDGRKPARMTQLHHSTLLQKLPLLAVGIACLLAASASRADEPKIRFQVLERWKADLGNRSIIYNRVAPPVLPATEPSAEPAAEATTQQTAGGDDSQQPEKKIETLFVFGTVYNHRVTELRWYGEGREYRAFSTIDFAHFCGSAEFETEDTIYTFMLAVNDETTADLVQYGAEHGWPKQAALLDRSHSQYLLADGSAPPEASLSAIDLLHLYYDMDRQNLVDVYTKREAERIKQEQHPEPPAVPQDTVINFWPKKSSVYLGSESQGEQP
jgi:hypothetical protein